MPRNSGATRDATVGTLRQGCRNVNGREMVQPALGGAACGSPSNWRGPLDHGQRTVSCDVFPMTIVARTVGFGGSGGTSRSDDCRERFGMDWCGGAWPRHLPLWALQWPCRYDPLIHAGSTGTVAGNGAFVHVRVSKRTQAKRVARAVAGVGGIGPDSSAGPRGVENSTVRYGIVGRSLRC